MKNICYIISGIDKALAFEWISELLDKNRYKIFFVLLHTYKGGLEEYFIQNEIDHIRFQYKNKSDLFITIYKIRSYLLNQKIDIVHCHLLDAGLAGVIAAKLAGIQKIIYTRHHSTYHHTYFKKGVLYDKIINYFSTQIVAVSKNVKDVLIKKEGVKAEKIKVNHHGFPLELFDVVLPENILNLKAKYHFSGKSPVIGVVSRYEEWKGIQYIIPAFKNLIERKPNAHLVLANARGSYTAQLKSMLETLPKDSYTEIEFEDDLFTLFKTFDIFVHTPVDNQSEAFGQVYVEAMAAGIPCIFTLSGIGSEIAIDRVNSLVVPYKDSNAINSVINLLLSNPVLLFAEWKQKSFWIL